MSYNYTLDGALKLLISNAKISTLTRIERGRKMDFDIELTDLENLWNIQNGRCYHSGIPMNYDRNEWRVSIERLDNDLGYIKLNVVLCCLEFNTYILLILLYV